MKKTTLVDISLHFFLSLIISAWIYLKTRNPVYPAVFLLGGVFVDIDHLIDYFFYFRKFSFKNFLNLKYLKSGKVYLFFHAWEINFIILALALSTGSFGLYLFFLSASLHLAIDNLQRKNPLCYFFIYRLFKKFDVYTLLPEYSEEFC